MTERGLDATDSALRNSVVFKVVRAPRHAKRRRRVRMVEKRKGMCVWAPSLRVPLPGPADRHSERPRDPAIDEGAVTLTMILEPGGMDGIGAQVLLANPVILAADHAAEARGVALRLVGVNPVAALGLGVRSRDS